MSYVNEPSGIVSVNVIGEIRLPITSISEKNPVISVSGDVEQVFHLDIPEDKNVEKEDLPIIKPGISAFNVTCYSGHRGRTVRSFIAIIDEVISYRYKTVNEGTADESIHVELEFRYKVCPTTTYGSDVTVVQPVLAHIYSRGSMIGLIFEGPEKACVDMVKQSYRVFSIGGQVYHAQKVSSICMAMTDNPDIDTESRVIAVSLMAATTRIPESQEIEEAFEGEFEYFISKVYGSNYM